MLKNLLIATVLFYSTYSSAEWSRWAVNNTDHSREIIIRCPFNSSAIGLVGAVQTGYGIIDLTLECENGFSESATKNLNVRRYPFDQFDPLNPKVEFYDTDNNLTFLTKNYLFADLSIAAFPTAAIGDGIFSNKKKLSSIGVVEQYGYGMVDGFVESSSTFGRDYLLGATPANNIGQVYCSSGTIRALQVREQYGYGVTDLRIYCE